MIFPGWGFATVEASGIEHPRRAAGADHTRRRAPRRRPAARDAAQPRPAAGVRRQCRGCRLAAAPFRRLARRCRHRDLLLPRLRAQRRGAERAGTGRRRDAASTTRWSSGCGRRGWSRPGFSLGSGVAAQLARRRPLGGVILVTAFDSIAALAAARYPFVPVSLLMRHPFRSDAALAGLRRAGGGDRRRGRTTSSRRRTPAGSSDELAQPVLVAWIADADHVSIYDRRSTGRRSSRRSTASDPSAQSRR